MSASMCKLLHCSSLTTHERMGGYDATCWNKEKADKSEVSEKIKLQRPH